MTFLTWKSKEQIFFNMFSFFEAVLFTYYSIVSDTSSLLNILKQIET